MNILVVDEWGQHVVIFGKYEIKEIEDLIMTAKKHNMSCLSFIDVSGDTYFNELQCEDIKKELEILRTNKALDKNLLNALLRAADTALKSQSYIKIT